MRRLGIHGDTLSGIDLAPLCASTSALENLNLSHSDFGDFEAGLLARGAQAMPLLKTLVFTGCQLQSVSGARSIALAITSSGSVRNLYLWINAWETMAYHTFAMHLGDLAAESLRDLRIGYRKGGATAMDGSALEVLLNKTTQLEKLWLMNMNLGSSSLAALGRGTLALLNLRRCSFDDCLGFKTQHGGQLLAKMLAKVAPNLRVLAFRYCAPKLMFSGMANVLAPQIASGSDIVRFEHLRYITADTFDDDWDIDEYPMNFDRARYQASAVAKEALLRRLQQNCPNLQKLESYNLRDSGTDSD